MHHDLPQLQLDPNAALDTAPPFGGRPLHPYAQPQPSPTDSDFSEMSPVTPASSSTDSFGCPQAPSLLPSCDSGFLPLPSSARTIHSRVAMTHPYARLFAKQSGNGAKRRKIWNHALEKSVFTAHEIATMGAPHRRTIYMASLEAHVDRLHSQMLDAGYYPIPFEKLEPFRGLNSKTVYLW